MSFIFKNWLIELADGIGCLMASLPLLENYSYKFAKIIVKYHDNDSNPDMYRNGEYHLLSYLTKNQLLKTVFDVGANIGEYSAIIASCQQIDGRIYAFDPGDNNVEVLRKKFHSTEGFYIIPKALSDYNGTIDFHQNDDPSQSGTDSVYDMNTIGYHPHTQKISVPCTTIDSFCENNHIEHINLVKIDVEGHELFVLKGGGGMLSKGNIDYIQFEYGHAARAARVLLLDIVNLLENYGYSVYLIMPKGIKRFIYSPWEENKYNMMNFFAVSNKAINAVRKIII
jgi:FkbM family methyltransferase